MARSTPEAVAEGELTTERLLALGREAGLAAVGIAPAEIQEPARTTLHLRKRAGRAGAMQFTYRNPDRSTNPRSVLPSARSIIAGALGYGHWQPPSASSPGTVHTGGPSGRVARYAWHDHYADLRRALEVMAEPLRVAGQRAVVVADGNSLVDRNAAWSAGLGWYGKNANLLLPGAGSWHVLGAVVTDAVLEPSGRPQPDGCGSCTRCLDDCPTGAIVAPGVVDATRCLAWLVQADGVFPRRWRAALGDRIYGCDDCQEVCPPNRSVTVDGRHATRHGPPAAALDGVTPPGPSPSPGAAGDQVEVDLTWLLTAPDSEILSRHGRWYIADRNVDNIRRSALVALGNAATPDHPSTPTLLARYLRSDNPVLVAHALWAARRVGLDRWATEEIPGLVDHDDPLIRAEWSAAVEARYGPDDWTAVLGHRSGGHA